MPQFVDYLTLLLLNLTAGLILLAIYIAHGITKPDQRGWAAGFAVVGLVGLIPAAHMLLTWPLPGPYNPAFGETSFVFGAIFLGAALALGLGWRLSAVALYGAIAGIVAIILGIRIIDLHLTAKPLMSGVGFILTGAGGVLVLLSVIWPSLRALRGLTVIVLIAAALLWAATTSLAYWGHMQMLSKWKMPPAASQPAAPSPAQPAK